ncbi:hypothetical protein P3T75_10990 [Enterococcus montenegrensis]|nr:hypothetical protein [Enterococcus montenegrensis]WHA10648.1 hypothetical protein P3T75_10990 [Enterococcus montenegrensis]
MMNRAEALKIGKIIADRWWRANYLTIKTRQNIERMKKARCREIYVETD